MLKNLMTAEKASRRYVCNSKPRPDMICVVNSAASSAYWASGQKGPLKKSYAAEQRKAPPVSYARLWAYTKHPIKGLRQIASPALCYLQKTTKIRILTDTNAGSPKVIPLCDKCSKYRPSVVRARDRCCVDVHIICFVCLQSCLECTEDYCSACFIRLHQNGALADHHASPILQQVQPLPPSSRLFTRKLHFLRLTQQNNGGETNV